MPNVRSSLKLQELGEAIELGQRDDPFAPVTVIVPSPYARVQLRREVGLRRGVCNVSFRTWTEALADLARLAGPAVRLPTPRMVNEALRQVLVARPTPFSSFARSPVARTELVALFSDLWRSEETLLDELARRGGRAQALVETLGALGTHLAEHGFTPAGALYDLAALGAERVAGVFVQWFPSRGRAKDRAVLDRLAGRDRLLATVSADENESGQIAIALRCADADEEVRAALRRVLSAAESGVPLWRQAILHPPSDRYRRIVHQQLAAAGVPTAGRASTTLAQSATGRMLLGALALADGGWRREAVMNWLRSAPVTTADGLPAPIGDWDEISARAGVVEGLAQWRSRLGRFSVLGRRDEPYAAHSPREAGLARSLAEFVDRLADDLTPNASFWSEWARWGTGILDRYLCPDDRTEDWPRTELIAAGLVRELLRDLGGLDAVAESTDLAAFGHAVADELTLRALRDDGGLAKPGSEADAETAPELDLAGLGGPIGSGVFVGSPAEARGLVFDAVCLTGLADEQFPGAIGGDPLLLGPEPEHEDWPTRGQAAAEALDDLASALALAGTAVATWPGVDPRTGREYGRSRWLEPGESLGPTPDGAVPSFVAGLTSPDQATTPVSPAERLLSSLAKEAEGGRAVETHPAVVSEPPAATGLPPLALSLGAARSAVGGSFSRFEGNVGAHAGPRTDRVLSPTSLEDYARCPRRYLFARELGLHTPFRPEANERMAEWDRGVLIHEILARYVGERIEGGLPPSLERLVGIARERLALAEEEGRCGPPVVASAERSVLLRELRRFFEEDRLEPVAVELAFGVGSERDAAENGRGPDPEAPERRAQPVEVVSSRGRVVTFRGFVDRIDRDNDGTVVVSDYKTGRQSGLSKELKPDPVAAGTRLQLPIYALAAQAYLDTAEEVRARYWLTSWNRSHPSLECRLDDRLLTRLQEVVELISGGVEAGVFPGVPGDEAWSPQGPTFEHCAFCDFNSMCPTDRDRRWAAQRSAVEVEPVTALDAEPDPDLRDLVVPKELGGDR